VISHRCCLSRSSFLSSTVIRQVCLATESRDDGLFSTSHHSTLILRYFICHQALFLPIFSCSFQFISCGLSCFGLNKNVPYVCLLNLALFVKVEPVCFDSVSRNQHRWKFRVYLFRYTPRLISPVHRRNIWQRTHSLGNRDCNSQPPAL
jgi:hypothetical protein